MMRPLLRGLALGCALGLLVFALATLRMLRRGAEEMRRSDAAFHRGDLELALAHARRAAVSHVPAAEHGARAVERMRAIALGAERAREPQLARAAWRALRAAALETRHVWMALPRELSESERNLTRLQAQPSAQPRARP